MKKRIIELLLLSAISAVFTLLLLNYFEFYRGSLAWPNLSKFVTWFFFVFIPIAGLFYLIKPIQKLASIPDGHQKLYNKQNQIAKEGMQGRQIN